MRYGPKPSAKMRSVTSKPLPKMVRKTDQHLRDSKTRSDVLGAARKDQAGRLTPTAHDLHILPHHPLPPSGTKRLEGRLLCRKAGREVSPGRPIASQARLFLRCEETIEQ